MKRIGETAVREALKNGAKLAVNFGGSGYRVTLNHNCIGYAVSDLIGKLIAERTIIQSKGDLQGTYIQNPDKGENK